MKWLLLAVIGCCLCLLGFIVYDFCQLLRHGDDDFNGEEMNLHRKHLARMNGKSHL